MVIEVKERDVKDGVLALVLALVEIIRDALRLQAIRRLEGGSLTEAESERLGKALMDFDAAVAEIEAEHGLTETVRDIRDSLDNVVATTIDRIVSPDRRGQEVTPQHKVGR